MMRRLMAPSPWIFTTRTVSPILASFRFFIVWFLLLVTFRLCLCSVKRHRCRYTKIFSAISLLMATRASFTFTITLPPRVFTTVTSPPTTKPRFSKWRFTSGLPPMRLMIFSSPTCARLKGIICLSSVPQPVSFFWLMSLCS